MNLKKILCIRADNMGDLLMSSPAFRALKETFNAEITLLTSTMAAPLAQYVEEVDEVLQFDIPWVKTDRPGSEDQFFETISRLKKMQFDAALIFTVYSQNPLPAALMTYLADIPVRAAYCRENPYQLLTHWIPDQEPYTFVRHQVKRDLELAAYLGASTADDKIRLHITDNSWPVLRPKLTGNDIDPDKPWIVMHPGVSEKKRRYPNELWAETAALLSNDFQIVFTGSSSDKTLTDDIVKLTGKKAYTLAGQLDMGEFMLLVKKSPLIITVNTLTSHLAAAFQIPQVVLYALTNPQHLPWRAPGKAFFFQVPEELKSKNEVVRFVDERYFSKQLPLPLPQEIASAALKMLSSNSIEYFPELVSY